ncbi:MAG: hypothetical protein H0U71_03210 [Gammaproteobacteria bacterium]|nr:hypothetical protein [Gammaproteobacteria bacterium]
MPTLNVKLTSSEENLIDKALSPLEHLPSLSAVDLLAAIKTEKMNSPIMQAIYKILTDEEGETKGERTYYDSANLMTIGVGLNLANYDAKAVIMTVSKELNVDPAWNFEQLQSQQNKPDKKLTIPEIKLIFYYTLTGTTYPQDNKSTIVYEGKIDSLIHRLEDWVLGLSHKTFQPRELVCLLSMAFNNPGKLIGQEICDALVRYSDTKDSLEVVSQIMECSNSVYHENGTPNKSSNGLQNRRMKEARVFVNKEMHISYRKFKAIEEALGSVVPRYGDPIYSQSYGENELTFPGAPDLKIERLFPGDGKPPLLTYYGSHKNDPIIVEKDTKSPVVFGGGGNHLIEVGPKPNSLGNSFPYLAGGSGSCHYKLTSQSGKVLINAPNGEGKITIDDKYTLQGIMTATDTAKKQYKLISKGQTFKLQEATLSESNQLGISWEDPHNDIVIPNYASGQLKLVMGEPSFEVHLNRDARDGLLIGPTPLASPNRFVNLYYKKPPPKSTDPVQLFVNIVDGKGKIIRSYTLASHPHYQHTTPYDNTYDLQVGGNSLAVYEDGSFIVVWGTSSTTTPNFINPKEEYETRQETSLYAVVCSEKGMASIPVMPLNNASFCELTTTLIEDENHVPKVVRREGAEVNMANSTNSESLYKEMAAPQVLCREKGYVILYCIKYVANSFFQKDLMCQTESRRSYVCARSNREKIYFLPTIAPLANGNFVLAIQNIVSDGSEGKFLARVSTHIMNPSGKMATSFRIKNAFTDNFSVSLSSAGKGFMIATKDEKGLRTQVYNGHSWSNELSHDGPSFLSIFSKALGYDYTLLCWPHLTSSNSNTVMCKVLLVDANNQPIGEPTVVADTFPTNVEIINKREMFIWLDTEKAYLFKTGNLPAIKPAQTSHLHNNKNCHFQPAPKDECLSTGFGDFILINNDDDEEQTTQTEADHKSCLLM